MFPPFLTRRSLVLETTGARLPNTLEEPIKKMIIAVINSPAMVGRLFLSNETSYRFAITLVEIGAGKEEAPQADESDNAV